MSRRRTLGYLCAFLFTARIAAAQVPPAPEQAAPAAPAVVPAAKIAWINLEEAIFRSEEGKRELGAVQSFVEKKNQELQGLQKKIENLRNQLQVQAARS